MYITELFDRKNPFKWVQRMTRYWRATFDVNEVNYSAACREDSGYTIDGEPRSIWELYFIPTHNSLDDSVVGTSGKEFLVFATALQCFEEFLTTKRPEFFQISANLKQPQRIKLYERMIQKMLPRLSSLGYVRVNGEIKHNQVDLSRSYKSFVFQRAK